MEHHDLTQLSIPLERDGFTRAVIGDLAEMLEDVVGLDEAEGFISLAGQDLGRRIDAMYRAELGTEQFSRELVADVLVDLKRRIEGDFHVIDADDDRIVFGNRRCPFADEVTGRHALCMMTSNVFGHITSHHLGYARVVLDETIARGDGRCRVVVHLRPPADGEGADGGRVYFGPERAP